MNGNAEREEAVAARTNRDWHDEERRRTADENRTNLRELPMNNDADEIGRNAPGDILAGREPGTTESLFNPKEMGAGIITNCIRASEISAQSPGEQGISGIGKLMRKTLEALNVSIIYILLQSDQENKIKKQKITNIQFSMKQQREPYLMQWQEWSNCQKPNPKPRRRL